MKPGKLTAGDGMAWTDRASKVRKVSVVQMTVNVTKQYINDFQGAAVLAMSADVLAGNLKKLAGFLEDDSLTKLLTTSTGSLTEEGVLLKDSICQHLKQLEAVQQLLKTAHAENRVSMTALFSALEDLANASLPLTPGVKHWVLDLECRHFALERDTASSIRLLDTDAKSGDIVKAKLGNSKHDVILISFYTGELPEIWERLLYDPLGRVVFSAVPNSM